MILQYIWDTRFIQMAKLISTFSKDPSTQAGAVIVRPDRTVAACGYNGFPRAMADDRRLLDDREEKLSRTVHAEMNAILTAREPLGGCTIYVWPFLTCDRCAVHIIQSGIVRVVAQEADPARQARWSDSFARATKYYRECGVDVFVRNFEV